MVWLPLNIIRVYFTTSDSDFAYHEQAFRNTFNILIGSPPGLATFVVNKLFSQSLIFILIAKFIGENKYTPVPGSDNGVLYYGQTKQSK